MTHLDSASFGLGGAQGSFDLLALMALSGHCGQC